MIINMTENPPKSFPAADKVSDNWVIVLLNDKYLNTLIQATKTLNADKIDKDLEASAKGEKSACKKGLANSTFKILFTFNRL